MADSGSTTPPSDSPEEPDHAGQAPPGYPPTVLSPEALSPTEILPAPEVPAEPVAEPRWVPPAPPPPPPAYGPPPSSQPGSGYEQSRPYKSPPVPGQTPSDRSPSGYGPPQATRQGPEYEQPSGQEQSARYEQAPGYRQGPRYEEAPRYGQGPGSQQPPGSQQGPGYQQPPGYQEGPGYQQPPGSQQGPGYQQPPGGWGPTSPGPAAPRRRSLSELADTPPQLVASLVISVGVVVLFIANLFIALGEPTGTAGNVRMLQFLSAADLAVGAILVMAVALVVLAPPPALAPIEPTIQGPAAAGSAALPDKFRLVVGFVSVAVAAAGLVRAIVVLTIAHQRGVVKLGNMIDALAAVAVAAAAAYWALRPR